MVDDRKQPRISSLFVFDSIQQTKEGLEHEKILYYYPPNTSIDDQVKHMGLIEALCQFTISFNCKNFQCFRTQKTIQLFHELAEHYYAVMIISIPLDEKSETPLEHGLSDQICSSILEQACDMFKLFTGSIHNVVKRKGADSLKQRLAHFFPRYLANLRIHEADLLHCLNGVPYLALDRLNYMKVQCFLNHVEAAFPAVKYTTFLYNDSLVASSLSAPSTMLVYRYLTSSLLPAHPDSLSTSSLAVNGVTHLGRFVCGPPNLQDPNVLGKTPKLFLEKIACLNRSASNRGASLAATAASTSSSCSSSASSVSLPVRLDDRSKTSMASSSLTDVVDTEIVQYEEVLLVVYRALRATVCLFCSADSPPKFEFYRELDSFLGRQLTELSHLLKEACAKQSVVEVVDSQYRFVCFNATNHALKSSVHVDGLYRPVPTSIGVLPGTMASLEVLYQHLARLPGECGEILSKTEKDVWIVSKKSSGRRLLLISQRGSHLLEVDDDCHKLCASQFGNIFFLE